MKLRVAAMVATSCAASLSLAEGTNYMDAFTPPVVLSGIDVVEYQYLDDSAPGVYGSRDFQYQWTRADMTDSKLLMPDTNFTFYFKNQANLDTFSSNPAQYAPQYGGY